MSPSLVHQPQETRSQPVPGMSRVTTPASYRRFAASAGSAPGSNETSVAWPGAVTTVKRSERSAQARAAMSREWCSAQDGTLSSAASSPASDGVGSQPPSNRAAPARGVYAPVGSCFSCEKYVGSATSSASTSLTYSPPVESGPQSHF